MLRSQLFITSKYSELFGKKSDCINDVTLQKIINMFANASKHSINSAHVDRNVLKEVGIQIKDKEAQQSMSDVDLSRDIVVQRLNGKWVTENDVCNTNEKLRIAKLKMKGKETPIYIYNAGEDVYISDNVARSGQWEGDLVGWVLNQLEKDQEAVFVDIGANIGVFSLTAAMFGRHVVSVDPVRKNVQRLCRSIMDSVGFKGRVNVVHNALSDSRGTVQLGTYKGNVGGTFVKELTDQKPPKDEGLEVAYTVLLDDLLEIFKFKKAVMKIDVESFENKVLAGGKLFFEKVNVLALTMEWSTHKTRTTGKDIIDFLVPQGFKPQTPGGQILETNNYAKWPVNVFWVKL
ncbi:hypothetical protein SNE40_021790 [Patella caerulea]|uniref:Methyltransferase FkbM domain-containing protein n=1 Tax=Patella caerulea TaxID=87958 RepID=A0AAN8G4V9_PATCE